MHELGALDDKQHEEAIKQTLIIKRDTNEFAVYAEYVAEMARQMAAERFPEDVYSRGLKVYTTILKNDQEAAYLSMRRGILDYDRRHGYRGAEAYVEMTEVKSDQDEALDEIMQDFGDSPDLHPAVILEADAKKIRAYRKGAKS